MIAKFLARVFGGQTTHDERDFRPLRVDEDLRAAAEAARPDRDAISVRPYRDNSGIDGMREVLQALHTVRMDSPRFRLGSHNVSPAHAFELRYQPVRAGGDGDRVVTLQYVAGEDRLDDTLQRQLRQQYPDSQMERRAPVFTRLEPGVFVAGCTLRLRRYTLFPIRNVDQPGFEVDPTGSIIQEMAGAAEGEAGADVAVQIMFRPEDRSWTDGVPGGQGVGDVDDTSGTPGRGAPSLRTLAHQLRQPSFETHRRLFRRETIEHPPSAVDKRVATLLEEERGDKGWHLAVRVVAASEDPDVAVRRAAKTAGQFRNFYEHSSAQTFVPRPLTGDALRDAIVAAAGRGFRKTGIVKSAREVAGLVNVPRAEFVATTDMQWALSAAGRGVPPGTPRFDDEAHGVAGPDASDERRQIAMLDHGDPAAPVWFGRGSRTGTEAGVFPDVLSTHQFVGGATGQGKTTLLKNFARQVMNRGHGTLVYDPKGMDADDIVSLVPEGREDDLIYLEVGGDRDRSVGFNFLEPPTDADPGSQIFVDAVESMTDDIAALLAQSSGDQDYWGPRMDQIARNLVRGMAQAGHSCTLLDMYLVLLDEDGRREYAEMLRQDSGDRLEWLSTYAERELADMSQDDIRPVLGRLKELVENRTTRSIISHPESTASIREAVRQGRIIVVRDMSSQDTAGRLVATALVRRVWVAVRELTMAPDHQDPPPFFAILDEFNDIAAAASDIDTILSNARSFGLSVTAATQDLSAQLDDDILNAIEGQCQTFLSFNPGRSGDADIIAKQHSPDVDAEDLLNLSKYTLYMRTHDRDDELTHSYSVDAFPPVDGLDAVDVGRDADGVEALIDRSLDRYGAPRRSDQRVRDDSVFWGSGRGGVAATDASASASGGGGGGGGVGGGGDGGTDEAYQAFCEAAQTAHIRADADDADTDGRQYVPVAAVREAWETRRDGDAQHRAGFADLVERAVARDHLDVQQRSDGPYARLTDDGLAAAGLALGTGASASAGAHRHRWLLREAYECLTRLGCRCELPRQDAGGELPDGLAWLPVDPMSADTPAGVQRRLDDLAARYPALSALTGGRHCHIEAESSTVTRPEQMATNLRKAMAASRVCLFALPDGWADRDEFGYWARRAEQVLYDTERRGNEYEIDYSALTLAKDVDDRGDRTFYNSNKRDLGVGDGWAVRPADSDGEVVWQEAGDSVVVRTTGGAELGGFPSLEAVRDAQPANVAAWAQAVDGDATGDVGGDPDAYVVRHGDGEEERYATKEGYRRGWQAVPAPFVPEHELPRAVEEEDFRLVVFPDDDSASGRTEPHLYRRGDVRPLSALSAVEDAEGEAQEREDGDGGDSAFMELQ